MHGGERSRGSDTARTIVHVLNNISHKSQVILDLVLPV